MLLFFFFSSRLSNAQELVEEYWRKNPQKKAPRKSVDKKTPKKARTSAVPEDESEADEPPTTKKRTRKSEVHNIENTDMDVDEVVEKPSKKAKTNSTTSKAKRNKSPTPEEEEVFLSSMKEYEHLKSWEGLIKSVDTVEMEKKDLMVFFTL